MGSVSNPVAVVVRGGETSQRSQIEQILGANELMKLVDGDGDVELQVGSASDLLARCGGIATATIGLITEPLDPATLTELLNRGFFDVLHISEWEATRLERTLIRAAAFARNAGGQEKHSHNRFLETIVDAAPVGIAYWDRQGRYQRVNAALAAINGLPVEAHYGRTIAQVLPGLPEQASTAIDHVLRTGQAIVQEVSGTTPAQPGVPRTWSVSYYPVRAEADIDGVAAICEETTENLNADKERERFVSVLGHDLRNPLSAVLMSSQVLRSRVGDREKVIVDRIKRSALRMQRMIRDLLDFARLRNGGGLQIRVTGGDLVQLLNDVVGELKQAYPESQVDVQGPASLAGSWDLERLSQVCSNLIGNAIAHGTSGGLVRVELTEPAPDQVRIEVRNQGELPEPDKVEQFFQPFRSGKGEGNRDSLGLGLYIARALVQAHGGRVVLRAGKGETTANVTLPRLTGTRSC